MQEQRLLIILSNCHYLERRTFLNLADHFEKHGFTGTEKITRVSSGLHLFLFLNHCAANRKDVR